MRYYLWEMRPYFRQVAGQLVLGSIAGIIMNTAVVLPAILLGRAIDAALAFERGEVGARRGGLGRPGLRGRHAAHRSPPHRQALVADDGQRPYPGQYPGGCVARRHRLADGTAGQHPGWRRDGAHYRRRRGAGRGRARVYHRDLGHPPVFPLAHGRDAGLRPAPDRAGPAAGARGHAAGQGDGPLGRRSHHGLPPSQRLPDHGAPGAVGRYPCAPAVWPHGRSRGTCGHAVGGASRQPTWPWCGCAADSGRSTPRS